MVSDNQMVRNVHYLSPAFQQKQQGMPLSGMRQNYGIHKKTGYHVCHFLYNRRVKLSSWKARALQSLDATLIKHTWSS